MSLHLLSGGVSPQDVDEASTSALLPTGVEAVDENGNKYTYGKASGAVAAGALAVKDGGSATVTFAQSTEALGVKGRELGVAIAALADTEYGWFQTVGKNVKILSLSGNAADAVQYFTTTAGKIDDAGTTKLHGLHVHTAESGNGYVYASICYPHSAV